MKRQPIKNKNLSLMVIVGVPVVTLCVDVNLNDPFNVTKMICLTLIAAWLIPDLYVMLRSRVGLSYLGENKTLILSALFMVMQFFLIFFSPDKITAIFGDTQRRNGFVSYFSLTIIFLYCYYKSNLEVLKNFFKIILSTSCLVVSYGLLQITGNDFIDWVNPYNSAITTLGNPNFTSAFLALTVVSSLTLISIPDFSASIKFLGFFLSILSIYIILKSESRQGLYAIFVGLIFFLNMIAIIYRFRLRILIQLFTSIFLVIVMAGMLQYGPLQSIVYKDSVSVRGFYWRAAMRMLQDYPITGVGIDSYGQYFRIYKENEYVRRFGSELTSTNAHNTFLQFFATTGVIVGIIYFLIVFCTIYYSIKTIKMLNTINERFLVLAVLTVYITFQAQSFISIDNIGLSIWNWTISGILWGYCSKIFKPQESLKSANVSNSVKESLFISTCRILILIPTLVVLIMLRNSESDAYTLRSIADPRIIENKDIAFNFANRIIVNPFADPFLKLKAALHLSDMGFINEGYEEVKRLNQRNPNNYEYLWFLANFQNSLGNTNDSILTRIKITKIDPFNTKNYLILMELYKSQNKFTEMNDMLNLIIKFTPNGPDVNPAKNLMESGK